ncbi:hypothetical protein KYB31_23330 [Clostridium felsineum]|uniref:hypothetical protein n=1 Tax=Clostridium felsineum TaxID=36839 RepID=UPI00214DA17A|nr:hypothetical protein [Clostridium felsineum]MCR3761911.1 hypothetical protein [Clostridium felsineum]
MSFWKRLNEIKIIIALAIIILVFITIIFRSGNNSHTSRVKDVNLHSKHENLKAENGPLIDNNRKTSKTDYKIDNEYITNPIPMTIIWRGHGIYLVGEKFEHDISKLQGGKKIGNFCSNDGIYEKSGVESDKCVIVKHNDEYLEYYFLCSDTVNFNGNTYLLSNDFGNYKVGEKIGTVDYRDVFKIKGLEESKAIYVSVEGKGDVTKFKTIFFAYKK